MPYDPNLHHRRSIRLPGYDYSQPGGYYITVCTYRRDYLFGEVSDGEMHLNDLGHLVTDCWHDLPEHYLHVELDAFVVMPNHIHGILILTNAGRLDAVHETGVDGTVDRVIRHPVPEIVRAFKTLSARRVNRVRDTPGTPLWQRNYYEHIIRDDRSLNEIREYIMNNPAAWDTDPDR